MKPTVRWRRIWRADYLDFLWYGMWRGSNAWQSIQFEESCGYVENHSANLESYALKRIERAMERAA